MDDHTHELGLNLDKKQLPIVCLKCRKFFNGFTALVCLEAQYGEKISREYAVALRVKKESVRYWQRKGIDGKELEGLWVPEILKKLKGV